MVVRAAHMEPARASPMSARAKDFSIDALISRRPCDSSNDGSDADTPGPPPLLLDAGEWLSVTARGQGARARPRRTTRAPLWEALHHVTSTCRRRTGRGHL